MLDLEPHLLDPDEHPVAKVDRSRVAAAAARDERLHGLLEAVLPQAGSALVEVDAHLVVVAGVLLAVEVASILLLVAAVGAVILARRRTGLEDAREISVTDLLRSPQEKGTLGDAERGTMLEAGGPPER